MRIAIISGHFMPEMGYQEVNLAKAFRRLGHEVQVITSNRLSPSAKNIRKLDYPIGVTKDKEYDYSILRLPAAVAVRSLVISRGLRQALMHYCPDLAVVIGVGKLFPLSIFVEPEHRNHKLIALFGDNSDFLNFGKTKSSLPKVILKRVIYSKAVKSCDRLYLYTPETGNILQSYLPESLKKVLEEKRMQSTLGYDPDEFYFDEDERLALRKCLTVTEDEIVFITSTRVTRVKNLEDVIVAVSKVYARGRKVKYLIIGFLGDNYETYLKNFISKQPDPRIFSCYPFLDHRKVRQFCCASDVGIWTRPAISIQEAMGTGLPIITENKASVNHLVQEGMNGWLFNKGHLSEVIEKATSESSIKNVRSRKVRRNHIARFNSSRFSYDEIASYILRGLSHHDS